MKYKGYIEKIDGRIPKAFVYLQWRLGNIVTNEYSTQWISTLGKVETMSKLQPRNDEFFHLRCQYTCVS